MTTPGVGGSADPTFEYRTTRNLRATASILLVVWLLVWLPVFATDGADAVAYAIAAGAILAGSLLAWRWVRSRVYFTPDELVVVGIIRTRRLPGLRIAEAKVESRASPLWQTPTIRLVDGRVVAIGFVAERAGKASDASALCDDINERFGRATPDG